MERYFVVYKPYKMLSQFVPIPKKRCLADLGYDFPPGVNAVGRLDENSEGLLIITNDKKLNNLLLKPANEHKRVYWVQVQFAMKEAELKTLEQGVNIRIDSKDYFTRPCTVRVISAPANLPPRERRPVRTDLETEWIEMTLTEGKFHQVRKMCAALGHQVMRLVRVRVENLELKSMKPGAVTEIPKAQLYASLRIDL